MSYSFVVLSNAKLTVLLAALAATGSILDTARAPFGIVVSLSVALFSLTAFAMHVRKTLRPRGLLVLSLLSMLPVVFFLYAGSKHVRPIESDLANYSGRSVVFKAYAQADVLSKPASEITLEPVDLEFPTVKQLTGKTKLSMRHSRGGLTMSVSEGRVLLRVRGFVSLPRSDVKPWEFDRAKWLAKEKIFSTCYLAKPQPGKSPPLELLSESETITDSRAQVANPSLNLLEEFSAWYESRMEKARQQIVTTHRQYLPSKLADLLSSMVLGNRAISLPQEITYKFRDIGLSHILAASGFNLTIVIAMTFAICRFVVPWAVPANILCFLAMLAFVSLAGPSPSVLRAALMCSIMLVARASKRRLRVSSTLAGAFLLTVIFDPVCTDDLGLQLSYAATVGIVIGTTALSDCLYVGLSNWKKMLADALAVVLVAQFSVLPIQLFFFWKTGTLFVPANLLITPLVTPLTMIGFASSSMALLTPLQSFWLVLMHAAHFDATYLNFPHLNSPYLNSPIDFLISICDAVAFIPLAAMMLMVNSFASVDAAKIALGPPSGAAFVCYYIALLTWFASLRLNRFKLVATLIFAGSVMFLVWRPAAPLLTVARIHGQVVVVGSDRSAFELHPANKLDKVVERFVSYHAAHISTRALASGTLTPSLSWTVDRDVLLVYPNPEFKQEPKSERLDRGLSCYDQTSILAKARQLRIQKIVLVVSKSDSMTNLLAESEFIRSTIPHAVELSGWRNFEAVPFQKISYH